MPLGPIRRALLFLRLGLPSDNVQHERSRRSIKTPLKEEISVYIYEGNLHTKSIYVLCLLFLCFICDTLMCCFCSLPHLNIMYSSFLLLNYKPHPSSTPTPSVWVCHLLPACSFSIPDDPYISWSPDRDTLLEMATCVLSLEHSYVRWHALSSNKTCRITGPVRHAPCRLI